MLGWSFPFPEGTPVF